MTDLGVVKAERRDDDDVEPVQVTFVYGDGNELKLEAHGRIPFAWLVDFWTAPTDAHTAAGLAFLGRVLTDTSWTAFYALVSDPESGIESSDVAALLRRLLAHYEQVDPTTARSGGPKKSASGRQRTSGGSSGRRRAKAST
jgi:hypothetical protein